MKKHISDTWIFFPSYVQCKDGLNRADDPLDILALGINPQVLWNNWKKLLNNNMDSIDFAEAYNKGSYVSIRTRTKTNARKDLRSTVELIL